MLQKETKIVSPRGLVMSLFNAPKTSTLTIGQIIKAGGLFDIEAPTIRMAVTRLLKDRLIDSVERGIYRPGEEAKKLNSEIRRGRTADKKTQHWNGEWLMALTSHLGRSNKTRLKSMIRALQFYGFIEIELGTWVRPSNLAQSLDMLHLSLVDIGLDSRAYLMTVNQIARERQKIWYSNWPVAELKVAYTDMINTLEVSLGRLRKMSSEDAARESFVVGEAAIRLINLDPLLPKDIIDTEQFERLISTMLAYDKVGHLHWQRFLSS